VANIQNTHHQPTTSIAVSTGDPAGIGPDIIIDAWVKHRAANLPHFTVLGTMDVLKQRARDLNLDLPLCAVENGLQAMNCRDALAVIEMKNQMSGREDKHNARGIIEAIERGVDLVLAGEFSALTTCPINKKALYDSGFEFPGHTEFLASICEDRSHARVTPVMMLAGPKLRSVPVTLHITLAQVANALNTAVIVDTARITAGDLREKFGIANPVLAIAGLNPHAGEGGALGREEIEIIAPAVEILRGEGIDVTGPLPADTMFHESARAKYDVAICMYHDQALIPAKALGFDDAVNITLGLPIIRTSPDHGTAYDIAGTGAAKSSSFIAALKLAANMVHHKRKFSGRKN